MTPPGQSIGINPSKDKEEPSLSSDPHTITVFVERNGSNTTNTTATTDTTSRSWNLEPTSLPRPSKLQTKAIGQENNRNKEEASGGIRVGGRPGLFFPKKRRMAFTSLLRSSSSARSNKGSSGSSSTLGSHKSDSNDNSAPQGTRPLQETTEDKMNNETTTSMNNPSTSPAATPPNVQQPKHGQQPKVKTTTACQSITSKTSLRTNPLQMKNNWKKKDVIRRDSIRSNNKKKNDKACLQLQPNTRSQSSVSCKMTAAQAAPATALKPSISSSSVNTHNRHAFYRRPRPELSKRLEKILYLADPEEMTCARDDESDSDSDEHDCVEEDGEDGSSTGSDDHSFVSSEEDEGSNDDSSEGEETHALKVKIPRKTTRRALRRSSSQTVDNSTLSSSFFDYYQDFNVPIASITVNNEHNPDSSSHRDHSETSVHNNSSCHDTPNMNNNEKDQQRSNDKSQEDCAKRTKRNVLEAAAVVSSQSVRKVSSRMKSSFSILKSAIRKSSRSQNSTDSNTDCDQNCSEHDEEYIQELLRIDEHEDEDDDDDVAGNGKSTCSSISFSEDYTSSSISASSSASSIMSHGVASLPDVSTQRLPARNTSNTQESATATAVINRDCQHNVVIETGADQNGSVAVPVIEAALETIMQEPSSSSYTQIDKSRSKTTVTTCSKSAMSESTRSTTASSQLSFTNSSLDVDTRHSRPPFSTVRTNTRTKNKIVPIASSWDTFVNDLVDSMCYHDDKDHVEIHEDDEDVDDLHDSGGEGDEYRRSSDQSVATHTTILWQFN